MSKKDFFKLKIDDQVRLIHEAFEPEIYPVLESHGGGLEILDIEDNKVLMSFYGTCGGCPISGTTLDYVVKVLKEIDERLEIVIVEDGLGEEFY